jgi:hypothetical protein
VDQLVRAVVRAVIDDDGVELRRCLQFETTQDEFEAGTSVGGGDDNRETGFGELLDARRGDLATLVT